MPDLDIIRKGVSGHFVASYRLICGGADDQVVLAYARRGLAQSFVRGQGLPGLHERARLITGVGTGGASISSAIYDSRELLRAEEGRRHSHIADRALRRMLADGLRPANEVEAAHLLARYAGHELLEHRLLAALRIETPALGVTPEEFDARCERLHRGLEPAIDALARQLVVDPTGASVRTPPSPTRPRPSTREMLSEEVE